MRSQTLPQKKCLIVEDDALLAGAFQMVIEDSGKVTAEPVSTEAEAIERIIRDRPDVALLDIDITGGTSMGVATALLAKDVPLAFISGHAASDLPLPFSAMPYLQKPVSRAQLLALVDALSREAEQGVV